jgi:DNA-nicking Smr family endonuclease
LFNQARDSFVAGKKSHAKSLSAQGHALNDRMHALHRQASESIFQSRNSGGGGELLVDLHGLHPDEAVRWAKERIEGIKRRGVKVYIVAGTGHHSRGRAKVLPVVRGALEGAGYRVREGTNRGSSEGGVLIIYL